MQDLKVGYVTTLSKFEAYLISLTMSKSFASHGWIGLKLHEKLFTKQGWNT